MTVENPNFTQNPPTPLLPVTVAAPAVRLAFASAGLSLRHAREMDHVRILVGHERQVSMCQNFKVLEV
jgi:hypothetical protein